MLIPSASGVHAQDSGGVRVPEQAAYDVTYYDLSVRVDPAGRSLEGTLVTHAVVESPLSSFVLNLDHRLAVRKVWMPGDGETGTEAGSVSEAGGMRGPAGEGLPVTRKADSNQVWIELPEMAKPGDSLRLAVRYGGQPRTAPRPPWNGGVTWATTPGGAPWVATSCQTAGADLWWPVKDHPSDEPDSMAVRVTVPDTLTAAANGVLRRVERTSDSTRTFHWHSTTPVNTYGVAINVAPYAEVDTTYRSTSGMEVPVSFYALPSDSAKAVSALPQFLDHVRYLEETLGPYPFRADKYGIAQTPFKGMEHQTIIAYGNEFKLNGGLGYDAGFDALHFHELAHEWYGNCVTVEDWKDFWIHEGVATYLEALYAESLRGEQGYRAVTSYFRQRMRGRQAIAKPTSASAQEMYGTDVYFKGALVLHSLRYVIGREAVVELLRRFVYPTADAAASTDGSACRHVTTAEFVQMAEEVAGRQLDGFFSTYLYQAALPRLSVTREDDTATLEWTETGGAPFSVPVPVQVGDTVRRVDMSGGSATLEVPASTNLTVDPNRQMLIAR
jgi:aminopeptidase N